MSGDSSSSDEQTSMLKEAIDESLLQDDLYKNGITGKKHDYQPKPPQSLRNKNHQIIATNPFSLKVTPEFQKHVSQHLLKLLDKTIDDTKIFLKVKKHKKKITDGGIKLLHTSKKCVNSTGSTEVYGKLRKFTGKVNERKIDYEARAKEVAVSSEWVLSKREVKSWASSWRNNVEVVKLDGIKSKKKKR